MNLPSSLTHDYIETGTIQLADSAAKVDFQQQSRTREERLSGGGSPGQSYDPKIEPDPISRRRSTQQHAAIEKSERRSTRNSVQIVPS